MSRKVLITGGAGFIGSHTAEALINDGYSVRVFDVLDPQIHGPAREVPRYLHPEAEFMYGDVRDREALVAALQGVDIVYHLTALTGVTQSMYEVSRYIDANVSGTAMLWDAIINEGLPIQKVVLSSSRAIYGEGAYLCPDCQREAYPAPRGEAQLRHGDWDMHCPRCGTAMEPLPTREDKPAQPTSVYAQSKYFQEEISRMMSQSYGIPVVVLRYFNVYGPRQALNNPYTGIAPVFCSRIRCGNPLDIYEDGLPVRDFVHVTDVARANVLAAADLRDPFVVANIGSGEKLTILDMAQAIQGCIGVPSRLEFNGRYRAGDIRSCYASIDTAREVLGYEPSVSFGRGVADLVRWVEKQRVEADAYDASVGDLEAKGLVRQTENITVGAAG